jgi:hypothetical protein
VLKSTQKILTTIFWDCESILLIDLKERNTTVNGTCYASLLHRLRLEIKAKRRRKLARGVLLLQDNALVQQQLQRVLYKPPYSPDMTPHGNFLFPALKKTFLGENLRRMIS